MVPPELTAEQRRAASIAAARNRSRRAEVKDALRRGELTWAQLLALAGQDEVVAGLRVQEALLALPRVGPKRVERLMSVADVAMSRRLRGLGARQRQALAAGLERA